jgi:hypothetical protein
MCRTQDMGASSVAGVGKFLDVDVQGLVTWPVQIKIYYTANDLSQAGALETDLQGLYYWSGASNQWKLYSSSGSDDQGRGPSTTGVDTTNVVINSTAYEGFVYANAYHLTLMRIGATGGVVPVQMGALAAIVEKNNVQLHWVTKTEVNCFGFEIERRQLGLQSTPPNSQFTKVGFISGAGTSSTPREYSYSDKGLSSGRYAYRIKQIDKDGSFKYAGEVEVEIGLAPKEFNLVQNYPNPFNPSTTIEFTVPVDGRATLKVFDILGREAATLFDGESKAGYYNRVVFDASRLASGIYFSRLESRGKQILMKMVLMK